MSGAENPQKEDNPNFEKIKDDKGRKLPFFIVSSRKLFNFKIILFIHHYDKIFYVPSRISGGDNNGGGNFSWVRWDVQY